MKRERKREGENKNEKRKRNNKRTARRITRRGDLRDDVVSLILASKNTNSHVFELQNLKNQMKTKINKETQQTKQKNVCAERGI